MRKVDAAGPAEVVALVQRGVYQIEFRLGDEWTSVETLLRKYADRPISLADACLIRCAELHHEPRILTFDDDFSVYKWEKSKKFLMLDAPPIGATSVHERPDADL